MINERVQGCIADTLTKYLTAGVQMTGIACVGRILKTEIWLLRHELIRQPPGINSALNADRDNATTSIYVDRYE